jgi:hypothetical protein
MDLARYWRRFPEENLSQVIEDAVRFVQDNSIYCHGGESKRKTYALGFWSEALYHLYLLTPDRQKLSYLAEVVLKLEEIGMGLPPSLLGANAEAIPLKHQIGCPSPNDAHLRVVNLSRMGRTEFLVINPTAVSRRLIWETTVPPSLDWEDSGGAQIDQGDRMQLPAHGWVVGRGDGKTDLRSSHKHTEHPDEGVISL